MELSEAVETDVGQADLGQADLGHTLVAWWGDNGRDLPWRHTRDPWAVLVSELMLQQTPVARVVPRYLDFLERFADPRACAEAPVGAVIKAWAGLGYNRRAVNLHAAARVMVDEYGGRLPDHLQGLLALPGIGSYTARAVLAFAFERPVGVLDTNAARVLARAVAGRRLGAAEAQHLADRSVPPGAAWAYNQAVLDLGATVCRGRRPHCDRCPVTPSCRWALAGWPEPDPAAGTAGATTFQAAFDGSDRQGRGRLVAALVAGPLCAEEVLAITGWSDDAARATRVAAGLVSDGLAVATGGGGLALP